MRGPIDYIILGFEGNNFKGEILEELGNAIDNGTIKVLALVLVSKDSEGNVVVVEADQNEAVIAFIDKLELDNSIVVDDDIEEVGEILENNTSAGFLVLEHLWAVGLKKAIAEAGGFLVADGRIHPEAAVELEN